MKAWETSQVAYVYFYLNKLPTSNDSRLLCGLVACVVAAVSRLVAGCCSGTLSTLILIMM